ncbi:helix-turn-helix domain-containing protein [Streptomyces sp. NRRL F-5126]|uniref:helix-turn-helix domain-containing protein n=1 Tax=Streptomyces sp. NRRL F-5126 TaxID=1463857 RepID=UPI0004C99351|nr:helix-turn-helix transcriptional regulator [Streptomyces sp. NRRL F-5126]
MSGAAGAGRTEEFATLLRELKDRSGLSYGALAKRLHMSTSTLHRYCSGSAVPNEYAPVERFARVCRATPEQLVELHRHWILADAARGRRGERAAPAEWAAAEGAAEAPAAPDPANPGPANPAVAAGAVSDTATASTDTAAGGPSEPNPGQGQAQGQGSWTGSAPVAGAGPSADAGRTAGAGSSTHAGSAASAAHGAAPAARRRRRRRMIASAAVAAVACAVVLVVRPPWDGGRNVARERPAAGAGTNGGTDGAAGPSATTSPRGRGRTPSPSPSVSASRSRTGGTGASAGSPRRGGAPSGAGVTGATAPTVAVRPFVYDQPCSQHFLVNSKPEQVGPPASEQDAPRWAAAYGAASSGGQEIAITVQGTGTGTVVLEALHVRVLSKDAPLAWNDYAMGVGCGGNVETRSFDVDLDAGSPTVTVKGGQSDFPYKVSESHPQVFYVTAHTKAHDVRWELGLDWSSGNRSGTLRIADHRAPFRTSADVDRPGYDYPLGGGDWIKRVS